MLGELQNRKLTHLFHTMDADSSGTLQQGDYERLADRVADIRGWHPDSAERAEVHAQFVAQWAGLAAAADIDASGGVTVDEFLGYQDRVVSDPAYFEALVGGTVDFFFDFMDDDGDGRISRDEFGRSLHVFGVDGSAVEEAFGHVDTDGDGWLSKDEYHQVVIDFFSSDDPDAPGTWMLGSIGPI